MSDAAFNIFGVVAGALGLVGLVPLVYILVKSQLPLSHVKALDDLLSETKSLLLFVVEGGHLTDKGFTFEMGLELRRLQEHADELKIEAYRAEGYLQQMWGMVSGLSYKIYGVFRQVKKARTKIMHKAFEDKKRRASQSQVDTSTLRAASVDNDGADDQSDSPKEEMSRDDALTLQETPDVPHDTQDPPAYHAKLGFASFEQYTEAPRTTDGDAVSATTSTD